MDLRIVLTLDLKPAQFLHLLSTLNNQSNNSFLPQIISTAAVVASCSASGIGHVLPSVRSFPVVRYAPFYNFPNGVRSIHAVAPAFPAPIAAPAFPAPVPAFAPAPVPSPVFTGPALAPALPAPVFGPHFLPRIAPAPVAYPAAPLFARALPALPAAPFSPIVRAVAPAVTAFAPAPHFAPAPAPHFVPAPAPHFIPAPAPTPLAVARVPFGLPYAHSFAAPAPWPPAPHFKQIAWK